MSGIIDLLQSGAKSYAKDQLTGSLPSGLMNIADFAMSPQLFLAKKLWEELSKKSDTAADINDLYQTRKYINKFENQDIRDMIADQLPDQIGDIIAATPASVRSQYPNQDAPVFSLPSTPENTERFENTVRNEEYGTLIPGLKGFSGPLPEDNPIFQNKVENLPYDLLSMPVSGMPENLDIPNLMNAIGPGGDFMPRGNEKSNFLSDSEVTNMEQYFRGGLTGYRR